MTADKKASGFSSGGTCPQSGMMTNLAWGILAAYSRPCARGNHLVIGTPHDQRWNSDVHQSISHDLAG
jgi:hypothetical protein